MAAILAILVLGGCGDDGASDGDAAESDTATAEASPDGELDCLADETWSQFGEIDPTVAGNPDPEAEIERFLAAYQDLYDLGPVAHIDIGSGSLLVEDREVIVSKAEQTEQGGWVALEVHSCGPYPLQR